MTRPGSPTSRSRRRTRSCTSGERRAHASHPARKKPELLAAGPNEIWSWDITKLKGPDRGTWYLLYVNGGIKPKAVHAGRGTPMTSSTVSGLYAKLNIVQSFFTYYNTEHRHSGNPVVCARRHLGAGPGPPAATLRAAYEAHPERFRGRCPQPRPLPDKVWINEPPTTIENSNSVQTTQAA